MSAETLRTKLDDDAVFFGDRPRADAERLDKRNADVGEDDLVDTQVGLYMGRKLQVEQA